MGIVIRLMHVVIEIGTQRIAETFHRCESSRFRDHQPDHCDEGKKRRHAERGPNPKAMPAYRRQRGSIARGGRREIAHAPLQPDDQNPAGDAEYIQCDLPDQPATTDRKMRRPRQPETAQRLEHDRRRSEQPICHHDLTCDESDFARAATPARDEKIERRANTRAEQQRRREYMQTFDDDDAQLSRSRNTLPVTAANAA